jgi:hypothetical protein
MHVEEDDIPDDRYFPGARDLDVVIGRRDTKIALAQDAEWRKGVLRGYTCRWDDFCVNWSINRNWDGSLSKLAKQMYSPVLVNPGSFDIHEQHYVMLALNSWVVKEDITRKQVWDAVEIAQRRIGEKIGGLKLFPRNLAWYDLRKACNCSYPEIAEIWDEHNLHDIDVIVVERMKEEELITTDDLGNRAGFDDNEFLAKQINDGFLVNARCEDARKQYPAKTKIKDIFRDYRNYCLTGFTNRSRPITAKSPISETIRAAVSRMRKFIATFDRQSPRYRALI